MWLVTQCSPGNFFVLLATVCSSWVHINAGTSRRSILLPEGREDLLYIQIANGMASRTLCGDVQSFQEHLKMKHIMQYVYIMFGNESDVYKRDMLFIYSYRSVLNYIHQVLALQLSIDLY